MTSRSSDGVDANVETTLFAATGTDGVKEKEKEKEKESRPHPAPSKKTKYPGGTFSVMGGYMGSSGSGYLWVMGSKSGGVIFCFLTRSSCFFHEELIGRILFVS